MKEDDMNEEIMKSIKALNAANKPMANFNADLRAALRALGHDPLGLVGVLAFRDASGEVRLANIKAMEPPPGARMDDTTAALAEMATLHGAALAALTGAIRNQEAMLAIGAPDAAAAYNAAVIKMAEATLSRATLATSPLDLPPPKWRPRA